jgi:hypothetical protein
MLLRSKARDIIEGLVKESILNRLELHVGKVKVGRNMIAGHPVDIPDQDPDGGLTVHGVDQGAATGALKHLRSKGFKVTRHNDTEFHVHA